MPRRKAGAEITARIAEMTLDGLMMGVAATNCPEACQLSRRAWGRFVGLLLKDVKP